MEDETIVVTVYFSAVSQGSLANPGVKGQI